MNDRPRSLVKDQLSFDHKLNEILGSGLVLVGVLVGLALVRVDSQAFIVVLVVQLVHKRAVLDDSLPEQNHRLVHVDHFAVHDVVADDQNGRSLKMARKRVKKLYAYSNSAKK